MATTVDDADGRSMHCMEIRGGSQAVEEAVTTPGLDVWVFSRPHRGSGERRRRALPLALRRRGHHPADRRRRLRPRRGGRRGLRLAPRPDAEEHQHQEPDAAGPRPEPSVRRAGTVATVRHGGRRDLPGHQAESHGLQRRPPATALAIAPRPGNGSCWISNVGDAGNLPLGLDDETPYHQFAVTLGRGDLVLFYTDALIEAADPSGRLLGEEGLLALAREPRPDRPSATRARAPGGRRTSPGRPARRRRHDARGPPPQRRRSRAASRSARSSTSTPRSSG